MRRLAAVVVALGLLAAACGSGSGGDSSAAATLQAVPAKTVDAQTSRLELVVDRPPTPGQQPAPPFRIAGAVDYKAQRGTMSFDLSPFGLTGPPIEAVFDGTIVYEKLPATLVPGLSASKPWVKIDAAAAAKKSGVDVSGLAQGQGGDPSQALDYLRGASDDVKKVGNEDVRGVPTTHYAAVLDLEKAAGESKRAKAAIDSLIKMLGSTKQPADVWIDNDGRLRRLKYTVDLSKSKVAASTPGSPGSVTFSLELFDFGTPVQVVIPPPAQVTDLEALRGPGG